jgi:hypothetical protein
MWNVEVKVMLVIIRATGTISASLKTIPEQHNRESTKLRDCRKQPHWGTALTHRENANVGVQNIFHGRNNITCSADCKYRTVATVYTLETWFVSGISLQMPCIKVKIVIIILMIIMIQYIKRRDRVCAQLHFNI